MDTGTAMVNLKAERAFISGAMDYSILPDFFCIVKVHFLHIFPVDEQHLTPMTIIFCFGEMKLRRFQELHHCYDANFLFFSLVRHHQIVLSLAAQKNLRKKFSGLSVL